MTIQTATETQIAALAARRVDDTTREIAASQFGGFQDEDGSDAEMCFCAMEELLAAANQALETVTAPDFPARWEAIANIEASDPPNWSPA